MSGPTCIAPTESEWVYLVSTTTNPKGQYSIICWDTKVGPGSSRWLWEQPFNQHNIIHGDELSTFSELAVCLGGGLWNAKSSMCTDLFLAAPCSVCSSRHIRNFCWTGKYIGEIWYNKVSTFKMFLQIILQIPLNIVISILIYKHWNLTIYNDCDKN